MDGHERLDVVRYRQEMFLPAYNEIRPFFMIWDEEGQMIIPQNSPPGQKPLDGKRQTAAKGSGEGLGPLCGRCKITMSMQLFAEGAEGERGCGKQGGVRRWRAGRRVRRRVADRGDEGWRRTDVPARRRTGGGRDRSVGVGAGTRGRGRSVSAEAATERQGRAADRNERRHGQAGSTVWPCQNTS